ncbi:cell pattern formation-associated protein stuA [Aspergillus heteromorphus CBS 117.55]|uniref:Cell pattern formation-associated protein STUA n=1 Tax=Aspergillus heteromorphus CBS 117.55 TaxID=1448321 RepID=A0A317VAY0_9EURO|nr:cell pattern formation-associated protein stuA [Aspergillus heteromorphus CBS 117.55]PWY70411.1 cell pattern formation-associated protein stuA [Aspergillus heteromorphus CBS 117.55]
MVDSDQWHHPSTLTYRPEQLYCPRLPPPPPIVLNDLLRPVTTPYESAPASNLVAEAPTLRPLPPPTEKLELPSISQVHTRGPVDIPWYNHHAAERPLLSGDKLPALSLPTASQAISGQSYRTSYEDPSALGSNNTSARTSLSGVAPVVSEARSPPPSSADLTAGGQGRLSLDSSAPQEYSLQHTPVSDSYYQSQTPIGSMNQTQPYIDVHPAHLSSAQSYASHAATAGGIAHYPQYHQQPPVLQPASTTYGPASSYSQYAYPGGVTSSQAGPQPPTTSMSGGVAAQLLPLPAVTNHTVAPPGYGNTTGTPLQGYVYDTTGQVAPPGAKPRVTATLWEDEGSLCYQVEAKGVCVARREDNHMINGTKLLNVAGMTRGRRDGILKSEKIRHVVKIGPMHLKGVWIPFERALEFANKEKITDLLYPLFVHNIGGLLYHPTNQNRTNMVVQESQQRRLEGPQAPRASQGPQPPALHHHHSLQATVPSHMPQPHTMATQPGGRPSLDRAHTFPTPPASASSLIPITNQSNSYDWNSQGMSSGVPNTQPLSIDTALSNARSMPTTPATTPPGNNLQGMQSFQGQSGYDSKPYYSAAPPSHPHYASQQPLAPTGMASYGQAMQSHPYIKSEMGPPSSRTPGGQPETETADVKPERYSQSNGHVGSNGGESVPEHESEYVQHDSAGYNTSRGSYTYTTNPSVGSLTGDHSQLTPEITGSPTQQSGSGRMTPRTSGGPPPPWASGYSTPPRPAAASSLYNIVSDTRGTSGNGTTSDNYSVASNSASGYSTGMNGSLGSNKRMREDDDVDRISRPDSRGTEYDGKRRKTLSETSVGGPVGGVPLALQPMKAGGVMSRRR